MNYLRNAWYQAGWSDEVGQGSTVRRTILDNAVVLFRDADDRISALADRCAHRFAPLSRGRLDGNVLRCGYHGLGFDRSGTCVLNPHGPVPKMARVPSYMVVERHQAIWIWMGDPDNADNNKIPNFSFIDDTPKTAEVRSYMPTRANYQLLTDNILDLSHTNFLHADSIGGLSKGVKMNVKELDGSVIVRWAAVGAEPIPIERAMLPEATLVDNWVEVTWYAPALMILDAGAVPAGKVPEAHDHSLALHSMTPETPTTSHYFFYFARRNDLANETLTAETKKMFVKAFFEEDKPMIEAQQENMGARELWDLEPTLLPIDNAAVRARRKLELLISREQFSPNSSRESEKAKKIPV